MDDFNKLINMVIRDDAGLEKQKLREFDLAARDMYLTYGSYLAAGFDKEQAFELTRTILECALSGAQSNG